MADCGRALAGERTASGGRWLLLAGALCAVLAADPALASGTGLPWETPLQTIQTSLTGPVAMVVGVLGVVVCGAMLVFGGDLQEFVRRILYLVLAVSLLMSAVAVMTALFGAGGATV